MAGLKKLDVEQQKQGFRRQIRVVQADLKTLAAWPECTAKQTFVST